MTQPTQAELVKAVAEARQVLERWWWGRPIDGVDAETLEAYGAAERALGRAEGREEASEVVGRMLDKEYARIDADPATHTPLNHICLSCARYQGISEAHQRLTSLRRQPTGGRCLADGRATVGEPQVRIVDTYCETCGPANWVDPQVLPAKLLREQGAMCARCGGNGLVATEPVVCTLPEEASPR